MRTAKTDQTGWMPSLGTQVFAGHTGHFVGFVMLPLFLRYFYGWPSVGSVTISVIT